MTSSLSNLVSNLSEWLHRVKCKSGHTIKNVKHVELNISIVTLANFKDDLTECKCLVCNKNCQTKFGEKLKE